MKSPQTIYVDARALQDPDYRFRGVGQHSSALLRAMRKYPWPSRRPMLVALLDSGREPLQPMHRLLFDRVSGSPRLRDGDGDLRWFLSLSPMTHDPVWAEEYLGDDSLYRIALFYDLIPLEIPDRYLAAPTLRSEYVVALAWLRRYDRFAAISRFSADGLSDRMGVPASDVFVSGVAVRRSLEPATQSIALPFEARNCVVVAGGGDPRKNPECAIVAHAGSRILREAGITLQVFGSYPLPMREQLRALYAEHGGRPHNLSFHDHLTDEGLRSLYARAKATVVASRAEGFSIPIIESSAANTPVVVSDVGAHRELVSDPTWRFHPDDPDRLRGLLETLATDASRWSQVRDAQSGLWQRYTEDEVGRRLIEGFLSVVESRPRTAPAIVRNAKPNIAILSPLPPALSGVADYTAATLRPLKQIANLYMFTATPNARWEQGWAGLATIPSATLSSRRYDATLAVMGNSFHHREIHDYLMCHGGACLAHDARQIDYYFHERGIETALKIARLETGRGVSQAELTQWLGNQRDLPTLFLSELVAASHPLLVHSETTAREIERLYGVSPGVLPFAQYGEPLFDQLDDNGRAAARRRLQIRDTTVLLVTFGIVSHDKGPQEILFGLSLLRRWGVDAELVFCGMAPPPMRALIDEIATRLGVSDHVRIFEAPIAVKTYRDFLVAADVGIQLRMYFMGGLSGALNNCIAAALPSIANAHLAEAMNAPSFIRRIPDGLSSLLLGEAVLDILASGQHTRRPVDDARAFADAHSPEAYCRLLLEALGIDAKAALQAAT
jgi:glycosyltransferase involved in cell wall biosynthesis